MLKATFLTCAIIAMLPLIEGAQAGDAVEAPLAVVWTGRFVETARASIPQSIKPKPDVVPAQRIDGDTDIVGSIPPNPAGDASSDLQRLRGDQTMSLCALTGPTSDPSGQDLACGGALYNRWSAKARSFNYDLSTVRTDFANSPVPYSGAWASNTAPSQ
jgi:hypothetical protein